MYVIAGLGNPGRKYEGTRHNSGFAALDILAERYRIPVASERMKGLCGSGLIDGEKVLLVKPQTYMNLSGECIREIVSWYRIDPEKELIVLYDDISLAPGMLRVREKGSAGGHNGMKNIIAMLGTQTFKRVRIGVGETPEGFSQIDWVLGRFPLGQRADMLDAYDRASQAAAALVTQPAAEVMTRFNTRLTTA